MLELWKDIPGHEGVYECSNLGQVRTAKGKTTYRILNGKKQKRIWEQRVLKDRTPQGRDFRVNLWKDGKFEYWLVHRLVAMTFIPNPKGKPCINHIDGNPKNNQVNNLEWTTYTENQNHAFDNDLVGTNKKIVLISKNNSDEHHFRSMSKASLFIGKNCGYISNRINLGKDIPGYDYILKN